MTVLQASFRPQLLDADSTTGALRNERPSILYYQRIPEPQSNYNNNDNNIA